MAIDTRDKRASATNFILTRMVPLADGGLNQADREQVAGFYCGIAAGVPPAVTPRKKQGLLLGVYP